MGDPLDHNWILAEDGQTPIQVDRQTRNHWFDTHDKRIVVDKIGDVTISTVFLSSDHRWPEESDDPVLWETMIFGGKHDGLQERYTSHAAAIEGHLKAVALVKSGG